MGNDASSRSCAFIARQDYDAGPLLAAPELAACRRGRSPAALRQRLPCLCAFVGRNGGSEALTPAMHAIEMTGPRRSSGA
jgi:hypothetical protein